MISIKRKAITLTLLIVFVFSSSMGVYGLEINDIKILIDDKPQQYDVNPTIINGRTLVPMRGIFETLGATLDWDNENRTANATKEDMNISVEIGSYFATKNNQVIQLDVQPIIQDGRTMVPLRFISESFGADVKWIPETRTVVIESQNEDKSQDELQSIEDEDNNEMIMTYEKAIEIALKDSKELRAKELQLERSEELLDNTYLIPGTYNPILIQTKNGLQISRESAKKEIELTKESINLQVENAINDKNILEKEIALTDFKVNIDKEKLRIAKLKEEYGLESGFNLDRLIKTQEELSKEKEVLQLSLADAYLKLNNLLGLDKDERYLTEDSISYNPLEGVDIDSIIRKELSNNIHIWSYEKQLESAELGLKLYEYNAGQDPYSVKEIDISTAKNNLKKLKESLEKDLRSKYNQIKQLEENYSILEIKLDQAEKGLSLVRTRYDVGMVIELDLKEAELGVKQLKFNMEKLALQHEQLVKLLHNPQLAPTTYL